MNGGYVERSMRTLIFQGLHGDQMEKLLGYLGLIYQVDLM